MSSINEAQSSTNPGNWPAVLSLLLAATLWGVFWYPLRWLESMQLHGLWATFFIYCGTLGAMAWMLRGRLSEFAREPGLLIGVALASGWCNITFILAILEGNVVRVLLLFYLSPLWAILLGWLVLGERLRRSTLGVLLVAMTGVTVMLWRPEMAFPWPQDRADWLALSSGAGFALTNVLMRRLQTVSVYTKTVSSWLGVIVVAGVLILGTQPSLTASVATVGVALLLGAVMMVVMTLAVGYGVTHLPVQRSAVILLFELVVGAVSAQLLTDEVVHAQEWWGGALVIATAYLAARRQSG